MKTKPSTEWKEQITPDESARFQKYARVFSEIQARKSNHYGKGRTLHRKQLAGAEGYLEIFDDLPEFASQGIFTRPARYKTWVRLSNGGMDKAADHVPDIRGFSIKVLGVEGESALGNGPAQSQDFLLINQEQFAFAKSEEFVDFVEAASLGQAALLKFLFRRYGIFGMFLRLKATLKTFGKKFSGFATESFFSAVPIANGPYAVRVRMMPAAQNGTPQVNTKIDWSADFSRRLNERELQWDLQLQPYIDEQITPIEDASVNWQSPYTTVARLTLPRENILSVEAKSLAEKIETGVFDPWQALMAHRPLGEVQRARKVVYFESQKGRRV